MIGFPYIVDRDASVTFAEIERDARVLEAIASERESSAAVIEKLPEGSPDAVRALRIQAKRLRRAARCLAYLAGRVDRIELLNEPVRRKTNYGAPR